MELSPPNGARESVCGEPPAWAEVCESISLCDEFLYANWISLLSVVPTSATPFPGSARSREGRTMLGSSASAVS